MVIRSDQCVKEPTRHGNPKRVILRQGVLPQVTQVAVAEFEPSDEVELHVHPTMYENYYVLEGRAVYEIAGEKHEAGPGDFLVVPPGAPHRQTEFKERHRIFYWGIAVDGGSAEPRPSGSGFEGGKL